MTQLDLLSITLRAVERLRVEREHLIVEGRLSLMDRLQPDTASCSVAAEFHALQRFARDCREIYDGGATWLWCVKSLADCGFDAETIVNGMPNLCVDAGYGAAVSSFNLNPSAYVWVPVESLPTFYNPSKCGHAHVFSDDLEARELARRPHRLSAWFRRTPSVEEGDLREAAGVALQERILSKNDLPPCRTHLHVDWALVLSAAANIHGSVRPWADVSVLQAVDNYPFPPSNTPNIRCPEEERLVLRSLFFHPVTWDGAASHVADGQHRICGMRTAGVQTALINRI